MANRPELLNAMKALKEHCKSVEHCNEYKCSIFFECDSYLTTTPEDWDIEDGESNES